MFPYPSGDMHMGHAENYAYVDTVARFWRHRGYNVLNPIGWDSFGLPAENAAIQRGATRASGPTPTSRSRRRACKPSAPRTTGAACSTRATPSTTAGTSGCSRSSTSGVWRTARRVRSTGAPIDQTVLANEQVLSDGRCDRCGAEVVKKKLTQWYFKITDYADRLLDDLNQLEGFWPQKVIQMQRNWIGRSVGADIDFEIEGRDEHRDGLLDAPRHSARRDVLRRGPGFRPRCRTRRRERSAEVRKRFQAYLDEVAGQTDIERQSTDRPKTGVFLGRYADQPGQRRAAAGLGGRLRAGRLRPRRGHGRARARPARPGLRPRLRPARQGRGRHDRADHRCDPRDRASTTRACRSIPTPRLDDVDPATTGVALTGEGRMINSGSLDGLSKRNAIARVIEQLEASGTGRAAKSYRLRDWLISRQRFWGTPIPMMHTEDGRIVPVPDDQLPLRLPDVAGARPRPEGHLAAGRRRRAGWRRPTPRRARPRGATPTRWTRSSTARGISCASSRRAMRPRRSRRARPTGGPPSIRTSAASSTRSCTCSTRDSSRRCCSTWA